MTTLIPAKVKRALNYTKLHGYLFNEELDVIMEWCNQDKYNCKIIIEEITKIIRELKDIGNTAYLYDVYFVRGLIYEILEEYQNAIKDFTSAKKFEDALFERGKIYYLLQEYEKALSDLDSAIRKNKDNGDYYYYRGLTHKALGDNEKATKDLQKALKMAKRG